MSSLSSCLFESPIGTIVVEGNERGIRSIRFVGIPPNAPNDPNAPNAHSSACIDQLSAYFNRTLASFHSLHLAIVGTDFQQVVWDATMEVAFGETATYKDIAKAIGKPDAARAVGNALNVNPLLLIVPCHRILPSNKEDIGGFAAGSWRKEWLLKHES